jgi:ferredoxin-NADP reductase/ferredoxin
MGGMMGIMGRMMGGMMGHVGTPPKQLYPALMDMPKLSPEARQFIEREAQQRLSTGLGAITNGEAGLHQAMAAKDSVAMQQAAAGVREGLQRVESGAAALRALNEGQEPRQIALTWFRSQLSVPADNKSLATPGPLGLSWYHITTMVFLGIFVLATLIIQFARMRRISGLVQRLASRTAQPDPSGSPPPPPVFAGGVARETEPPGSAQARSNGAAGAAEPLLTASEAIVPAMPGTRSVHWSGALRIAAIFPETHDVKTFRLMNPDGGNIPFTFMPGQFLTFSVEIEGKRVRRSYTIASSPAQNGYVEVTVKRQEHGAVSCYLHDKVSIGTLLDISAPAGVFTFTGGESDSIVLIAGGVGITPMMSVVRYLTDISYPGEIFLLYGARTTNDFIFREELEYLQGRHKNLHIAATMSRAEGAAWMGFEGPVSKEFIAEAVPEIARRHIHLCGPPPMMDAVKAELAELGVRQEQVETEAFGPAEGVHPADIPERADHAAPVLAPPPAPAAAAPPVTRKANGGSIPPIAASRIRFTISGKGGPLLLDQSVLEAAEAIGVDIDYSCRAGTCGTCKVKLLEGAVTMAVEEGLDPGDKARGYILACQAKSTGDLVIEA